MTMQIEEMKPFYTKFDENELRLVFAYQYLTIKKDEAIYQFIPLEGKQIVYNLEKGYVTNLDDTFVFQSGKKYIRVPVFELIHMSGVHELINRIIEKGVPVEFKAPESVSEDVLALLDELEQHNLIRAIDMALDTGDKEAFIRLTAQLKK